MKGLGDEELQGLTTVFKQRLKEGETLDDIMPEAFAAVREASKRVLGMFPYDVQVLGGITLHQGKIAEMRTGEGKTLTATMPLYLNALTGEGVMLVTTNAYLSQRDAQKMGRLYRWMGLSIGVGVSSDPNKQLEPSEKRAIYQSDIVYTTNDAFGFDYLIENLATSKSKQYLRSFNYVIIDEVDSVLLDTAQTPLIISGSPRVQSNLYNLANTFIKTLKQEEDYQLNEEKTAVWLTSRGMDRFERYFGLSGIYTDKQFLLIRHVNLALRAHTLFELNRQYVIDDGEISLLSEETGRVLTGTKLQSGLHQAIEVKENVKISQENRAMAAITYQYLFNKFKKKAGMTGTGKVAEAEFIETYGLDVIVIPTHKPIRRIDHPDRIYRTLSEKLMASMAYVKKVHATGQPILLFASSVGMTSLYSELLLGEHIPHNVLNAYNTAKEAMIIQEAGQKGAVTVATALAGRGTDIELGPGVEELGGLCVIATERMPSRRIDLQVMGRAGRQGDEGESIFFVSLEDELIMDWAQEKYHGPNLPKLRRKRGSKLPLQYKQRKFYRMLNKAQAASDNYAKQVRQSTLNFDESLSVQRELIYKDRNALINKIGLDRFNIKDICKEAITYFIEDQNEMTESVVYRFIYDYLTYEVQEIPKQLNIADADVLLELLYQIFLRELYRKQEQINDEKKFEDFKRTAILKAIDEGWVEQVDYLQQLKQAITSRSIAQRNPVIEYNKEAIASYKRMKRYIYLKMLRFVSLSKVVESASGEVVIQFV